jgi:galactokinase
MIDDNMELKWLKVLQDGLDQWENNLKMHLEEMNNDKNRVDILQQKMQQLENELKGARLSIEDHKRENHKLQSELQASLETIEAMQKQRDALLETLGKELNAQSKLIKANYEVSEYLSAILILLLSYLKD